MNSEMTLEALTQPVCQHEGEYLWVVADGWQQGRGAFGGLVVAALVRALEHHVADDALKLRSLSVTMAGPVLTQESTISLQTLRRGKNTATVVGTLRQSDGMKTHLTAIFGASRTTAQSDWKTMDEPTRYDWREQEPMPYMPGMSPVFTQNMNFRVRSDFPFSGSETTTVGGWIQAKAPGLARDNAYLGALADAWWPVSFARASTISPMATIHFTMQFLNDWEGLNPDAPLYHHASSDIARDGYAVEFRQLWGEDGRLMALNQQTIVIIK